MGKLGFLVLFLLSLALCLSCDSFTTQDEERPITIEEVRELPPLTFEDVVGSINKISESYPEVFINSRQFSRLLFENLMNFNSSKNYIPYLYDEELWLIVNAPGPAWETYWAGEDAKARARAMFPIAYDMHKDKVDAFRHAYWNILICLRVDNPYVEGMGEISNVRWAELFTTAHEGPADDWDLEEEILDHMMDLHNNGQGRKLYLENFAEGERDTWESYFELLLFDSRYKKVSTVADMSTDVFVILECTLPNDSEIEGCEESTLIDPPTDPCSAVASGNGYYCGSNEELTGYVGDGDNLVYCQNGMTVYVETCAEGCQQNLPGQDDECIDTSCTPICSPGQTQCSGNDVEVCSADQCSYEFYYSCDANQTCSNGTCITTTAPPPVINSVSCTSYYRGDTNVTCTVYGSNFDCSAGSNAYIANFYNGPAQTCSSTQFTVSGDWVCNQELGFKQVSYRNSDNQRDDRTNLLELLMGDLFITNAWQRTVHEGATNVPMGANGCNFGPNVVLFVEGVAITNTRLNAEDQVLGDGEVTWPAGSPSSMLCVAKYSGASIGPDKECLYNHVTIVP